MFSSNTSAVSADANYIEDVFSTYLYTGTSATQAINNGIDLTSKGGLVWVKKRTNVSPDSITNGAHQLLDTVRGNDYALTTNDPTGQFSGYAPYFSFASNGFTLSNSFHEMNAAASLYVSWTFRKQPKFFDVVTYTGTGANRTVAHNLGSVPGCIIVKRLDTTGNWQVYHRSLANTEYLVLNTTDAKATGATRWNSTTPTATEFSLGTDATVNANGGTYVAYLFAHDAGGFGLSGTENVISCGSFTGAATVNLGYEPQFVLLKRTDDLGDWILLDTMRGYVIGSSDSYLSANTSNAESTTGTYGNPMATGFYTEGTGTYIYIAIRRGPMRTPTDATKVFQPVVYTGTNADNRLVTTGIVTDMVWARQRNSTTNPGMVVANRLIGNTYTQTGSTLAGVTDADSFMTPTVGVGNTFSSMVGFGVGNDATSKLNASTTSNNQVAEAFRRAPGFFDVVCYQGNNQTSRNINHSLGVTPEFAIVRSTITSGGNWVVTVNTGSNAYLRLNSTIGDDVSANASSGYIDLANSGSSTFRVSDYIGAPGDVLDVNESPYTYVAYLFASCLGVSKIVYYAGTGATKQINCGFTAGARFVLIKRLDGTDSWYVWDSARGIVAGNDPYLLLNSTAAEVTSTDYIDTYSAGFEISSTAPAGINANGGLYIALAIA